MKDVKIPIAEIYVPTKLRNMFNEETAQELADSILEEGQRTPILARRDGDRFVLIEGLHRMEACRALGEAEIIANIVQARKH